VALVKQRRFIVCDDDADDVKYSWVMDTSEKRLRMRAYQNFFLEFKRASEWKEMLVISEYAKNQRYCIIYNEDIMKELPLSFKNWH
jgi:hypothetical protein